MKRLVTLLLFACVLSLSAVTYADTTYWRGDHRFPMIWMHHGIGWYLDTTSIYFNRIDSNHCSIAVSTIRVKDADLGNNTMSGTGTFYIYYDEANTQMYECNSTMSNRRYLKPTGSNAESGCPMYVGEAAYYVSQGKKFYGAYTWKDDYLNKYIDIFSDDFYANL